MKLRVGDPWMPAAEYARSLRGLTVNLLVRSIEAALVFRREVIRADVVYSDPDFAVLSGYGAQWMLHADHAYDKHPMGGTLEGGGRGVGVEIRLHGCDPDMAEAAAHEHGFEVLAPAAGKPHGLREVYMLDPDGYVWVADVPVMSDACGASAGRA
jgi:catechol 2,3-dioxygenase-like lactoylglutathione lyase family enzyme